MSDTHITVYRVENESGRGPYHGSRVQSIMDLSWEVCPVPYKDPILGPRWDKLSDEGCQHYYIFGFASLEQFENWFYTQDTRTDMSNAGFILAVYEVPKHNVYVGHTQVIFRKTLETKLVKQLDIPDVRPGSRELPVYDLEEDYM